MEAAAAAAEAAVASPTPVGGSMWSWSDGESVGGAESGGFVRSRSGVAIRRARKGAASWKDGVGSVAAGGGRGVGVGSFIDVGNSWASVAVK